jgi:uncharacterized membrane protein
MTQLHVLAGAEAVPTVPAVRKITSRDLADALRQGVDDFREFPTHVIFLSVIYPLVGVLIARLTFNDALLPLLFPLAAGFALVGPFAAVGLYEMSRQRELGHEVSWRDAFAVRHSPSIDGIIALGVLLIVIFGLWIAAAQAIYAATFGNAPMPSVPAFLHEVFTTQRGWTLFLVGNGVGFLFAVGVLAISVVSFPLLLDRDIGAVGAILTSLRAVLKNPLVLAVWGLIVAALLVLGSLPLFIGLSVVVPILGHSTWHLYRKLVEPVTDPPIDHPPRPSRWRRYAAQFPAALFAGERRR